MYTFSAMFSDAVSVNCACVSDLLWIDAVNNSTSSSPPSNVTVLIVGIPFMLELMNRRNVCGCSDSGNAILCMLFSIGTFCSDSATNLDQLLVSMAIFLGGLLIKYCESNFFLSFVKLIEKPHRR